MADDRSPTSAVPVRIRPEDSLGQADATITPIPLEFDARFSSRAVYGVHVAEVSDLMRRMVKENLLKFDATPLFPERIAYTVPYRLSDAEARLYAAVTDYVREEFNRAEALENDMRNRPAPSCEPSASTRSSRELSEDIRELPTIGESARHEGNRRSGRSIRRHTAPRHGQIGLRRHAQAFAVHESPRGSLSLPP